MRDILGRGPVYLARGELSHHDLCLAQRLAGACDSEAADKCCRQVVLVITRHGNHAGGRVDCPDRDTGMCSHALSLKQSSSRSQSSPSAIGAQQGMADRMGGATGKPACTATLPLSQLRARATWPR